MTVSEIKWIDGDSNPADAMTKTKPCQALRDLIDTNTIHVEATGWVERVESNEDVITSLADNNSKIRPVLNLGRGNFEKRVCFPN